MDNNHSLPGFYDEEYDKEHEEELDEQRKKLLESITAIITAFMSQWKITIYQFIMDQPGLPINPDDVELLVDKIMVESSSLYPDIISELEDEFGKASSESADNAIKSASEFLDRDIGPEVASATDSAVATAIDRASEMFGLRRVSGQLLPDANAEWVITKTTRDKIIDALIKAMDAGLDIKKDQEVIKSLIDEVINFNTGTRPDMIARTELSEIWAGTQFEIFTAANIEWVNWQTSGGPNVCGTCLANEFASPKRLGDTWPSGDVRPIVHPSCACVLVPADETEGGAA